jgi:hypothetical protein
MDTDLKKLANYVVDCDGRSSVDIMDNCIENYNLMWNSSKPEPRSQASIIFSDIIRYRLLKTRLFSLLIPNIELRRELANYWDVLMDDNITVDPYYGSLKIIRFSIIQLYISYILLFEATIIDGSCRNRYPDECPLIESTIPIKPLSSARERIQDAVANVMIENISKNISECILFKNENEEYQQYIDSWISIFANKRTVPEILNALTIKCPYSNPIVSCKWNSILGHPMGKECFSKYLSNKLNKLGENVIEEAVNNKIENLHRMVRRSQAQKHPQPNNRTKSYTVSTSSSKKRARMSSDGELPTKIRKIDGGYHHKKKLSMRGKGITKNKKSLKRKQY